MDTLENAPKRQGLKIAAAIVTLSLWLVSVFLHREGGQIFAAYFHYGATHWGGGMPAEAHGNGT